MVELNPSYVQDLCYTAQEDRLVLGGLVCTEGVERINALRVTAEGGTMNVLVAPGGAFVANDNDGADNEQGMYHVFSTAEKSLAVDANISGVTRTDTIWLRVYDTAFSIAASEFEIIYLPDETSEPGDGGSYYKLATIAVPNAAGSITDGMITDERELYSPCGQGQLRQSIALTVDGSIDLKTTYPWLKSVKIRGVGGGAAGGGAGTAGATNAPTVGAGGGAGGYFEKTLTVAEIPDGSSAYTIGAGATGAAATAGANGGDTTFLGCTAGGGNGGAAASAASNTDARASGGAGGTASGGDVNIAGGDGGDAIAIVKTNYEDGAAPGVTSMRGWGGEGAPSVFGGGTGMFARTGSDWNGKDGKAPGAGGQGSYELANGGNGTGGDGKDGILILDLFG